MRTHINNERGSALIIEVIILIAALGVVGYLGYQGYQASQAKSSSSPTPTVALTDNASTNSTPAASTAPSDPYAGWKTYSSRCTGYSFMYPANWTMTTGKGDYKYLDSCNPVPVFLTSPSKNSVAWIPHFYGDGPGCDMGPGMNDCPAIATLTSSNLGKNGVLKDVLLVKQVVCGGGSINKAKCDGRIGLAVPDKVNNLSFSGGLRDEYPGLTFGKSAFYMTRSGGAQLDSAGKPDSYVDSGTVSGVPYAPIYRDSDMVDWLTNNPDVATAAKIMSSLKAN